MKITDLTQLEMLQGSFTLAFVLISILVGILFCIKYTSTKRIEHITLGFAWIFISSAWWGTSAQFLSIIFFSRTISLLFWLFLSNTFIAFALFFWIYSISHVMYAEKKKIIIPSFLFIWIIYEIILFILLFTDPSLVGTQVATFNTSPSPFTLAFQIFSLSTSIITGIIFSVKSINLDDPVINWRGRFLLVAFISFFISALCDALFALTEVPLVIIRIILISSAIEYYLAWFLPERLKNWLIR